MIKNARFESMIEVFREEDSGSGQFLPSKLGQLFGWPPGEKHSDGALIAKLSLLQSFDVYSLRIQLRGLGIEVDDIAHLQLSETRYRELDDYMRLFTRPLMKLIYADTGAQNSVDQVDLLSSFQDAENPAVMSNLRKLSDKLKLVLAKLPDFLTDYGDVFLSLAYFKKHLDDIVTRIEGLFDQIDRMKHNIIITRDTPKRELLETVEQKLNDVMSHISGSMGNFDKHTASMWENLDVESFHRVKVLIESNHSMIGGMLCGLHVMMNGYDETFKKGTPSDQVVYDYISGYFMPVIDRVNDTKRAPRLAQAR